MKIFLLFLMTLAAPIAKAFPPAPHHTLYGVVKNEQGTPLSTGDAIVILSGPDGEVIRGPVDTSVGRGLNYALRVPTDGARTSNLYTPTAMLPASPFTIRVVIGTQSYLPIQMQGALPVLGEIAGSTRLNLTLGVDSDGDGLPDSWERDLIDFDNDDGLGSLADVKPGDDSDGDGMSNLSEYIAGTYAFDRSDSLKLEVKKITEGVARLEFVTLPGRTYRIKSSRDFETWLDQPFSTQATGENSAAHLRGDEVTALSVYVEVGESKDTFFKLHVE
jgi:hypothetical protein